MAFDYVIDEKPVTWKELLKIAKDYGWNPSVVQQTSAAADYLRKNYGCVIKPFLPQTEEPTTYRGEHGRDPRTDSDRGN